MINCMFIVLMMSSFYPNYLDGSFFQKQYRIEKFKRDFIYLYYTNLSNSNKNNSKDFLIYALEFIACLPMPAYEVGGFLLFGGYNPDLNVYLSRKVHEPGFVISRGILYVAINELVLPTSCDFIGRLTKKRGNLKNARIGTLMASIVSWGIWCAIFASVDNPFFYGVVGGDWSFCLLGLLRPLYCVAGYNLK